MICSVAEFYIESYFDMTCYDNLFFYAILEIAPLMRGDPFFHFALIHLCFRFVYNSEPMRDERCHYLLAHRVT